jgi:hypothetical protein
MTEPQSGALMEQLENVVRRAVIKILTDTSLTATFDGTGRETYLDLLAFK